MTNDVKSVAQGLREIAEFGRIGRPVFVRWTATFPAGVESSSDLTDAALSDISSIFGAEPESTNRMGDEASGNVATLCTWTGGQTALVATGIA